MFSFHTCCWDKTPWPTAMYGTKGVVWHTMISHDPKLWGSQGRNLNHHAKWKEEQRQNEIPAYCFAFSQLAFFTFTHCRDQPMKNKVFHATSVKTSTDMSTVQLYLDNSSVETLLWESCVKFNIITNLHTKEPWEPLRFANIAFSSKALFLSQGNVGHFIWPWQN